MSDVNARALLAPFAPRRATQIPRALHAISRGLAAQVEPGRIESAKAPRILARVSPAESVATAVSGAGFVREAVVEKIEIKQAVFREAELNAAPKTILASNTSTFGIDLLAQATSSSERVVGAHWFNPPQIVPCVEVVPREATSQSTVERTVGLFRAIGEEPVVVKNVPAFIANRIQVAMVLEALRCLADGLASAEEIDRIVRTASGFRLPARGLRPVRDHRPGRRRRVSKQSALSTRTTRPGSLRSTRRAARRARRRGSAQREDRARYLPL